MVACKQFERKETKMERVKKRLLFLLVTLCTVSAIVPATAFAAEGDTPAGG